MTKAFEDLVAALAECSETEKQRLFEILRQELARDRASRHELEREFDIGAERILDAIKRGSDLTKRGVRGVIAETVFATEVAPNTPGWEVSEPTGDEPYDVVMMRGTGRVRIQVKMQRKEKGEPLVRSASPRGPKDHYVVEVQRTRSGKGTDGEATRPYKFGEFDLLAVCMQPSSQKWQSFLYIPANALTPRPNAPDLIGIMQLVPAFPASESAVWTSDLPTALERTLKLQAP